MSWKTVGMFALAFVSIVSPVFAQSKRTGVPEVDPVSAAAALALAVGGLSILVDRVRRR
jgi:hypothetical protein